MEAKFQSRLSRPSKLKIKSKKSPIWENWYSKDSEIQFKASDVRKQSADRSEKYRVNEQVQNL